METLVPFDDDLTIPHSLVTDEVLLRPIRTTDAELDHEAVMASTEFLRTWEQTGWPKDGFTVQENREDVAGLVARHDDRAALTFTVLVPDETQCLGCVYLFPTDSKIYTSSNITPLDAGEEWDAHDVVISFWVRTSRLEDGLDERLLAMLREWFNAEWVFRSPLFVTSERLDQQVSTFEKEGLRRSFRIDDPQQSGISLAFSEVSTDQADQEGP